MIFRFVVFLLFTVLGSAQLGAWTNVDPQALEVISAVSYALKTKYPGLSTAQVAPQQFKVVQAQKQVFFSQQFWYYFYSLFNYCS
jgi:hypothetical protein